jgi:hypothetical protein
VSASPKGIDSLRFKAVNQNFRKVVSLKEFQESGKFIPYIFDKNQEVTSFIEILSIIGFATAISSLIGIGFAIKESWDYRKNAKIYKILNKSI